MPTSAFTQYSVLCAINTPHNTGVFVQSRKNHNVCSGRRKSLLCSCDVMFEGFGSYYVFLGQNCRRRVHLEGWCLLLLTERRAFFPLSFWVIHLAKHRPSLSKLHSWVCWNDTSFLHHVRSIEIFFSPSYFCSSEFSHMHLRLSAFHYSGGAWGQTKITQIWSWTHRMLTHTHTHVACRKSTSH